MTKEEKSITIENLKQILASTNIVYIGDISGLNAKTTSNLRRACFKSGIKLEVVKNTLLTKAMDLSTKEFGELPSTLVGNTALFISETANVPAKIIKDFRKKSDKPILKGAYINAEIYIGDHFLDSLSMLKSKEEMIGEVIGLLQAPAQRIIAALQNQHKDKEAA